MLDLGEDSSQLPLSRDAFITATLLNQPAWIECILWDPEGSGWAFALCELTQGADAWMTVTVRWSRDNVHTPVTTS